MKKLAVTLVSGMLALSMVLAGCSKGKPQAEPEATVEEQAEEATEETRGDQLIVGGWTVQTEVTTSLTDDQRAVFDKGIQGLVGVEYEPVAELATQLVAGTNHAFLCKGKTVTAEPVEGWYVVTIYEDLEGNATVSIISAIDITKLQVAQEAMPADLVGGWKVTEVTSNAALLPEEAGKAFNKAVGAWTGVTLRPIATLGTQVVSGTNYLVLCEGAATTADPVNELYVATVYADLNGNAKFSSVEQLNLLEYVTGV